MIVEDDREIRSLLSDFLSREGYATVCAGDGAAMDRALLQARPDLIVLDIMLPGEDGLSICRRLRGRGALPILMLTAKGEDVDRIVGLEVGADDYVVKPFNPRELLARVKNVLRRANTLPRKRRQPGPKCYAFDRWMLDTGRRELTGDEGVAVVLSAAEFRLLLVLVERPRLVLSRDQLLDLTSGRGAQAFDRSIDNQISRLRRKIERDLRDPEIIKTVRSGGYLFAPSVEAA